MYEYANILVLGGSTGFLGRNVVEVLRNKGYRNVRSTYRQEYDLADNYAVGKMFRDLKPDVVINCAGHVGGIEANIKAPGDFFWRNTLICGNVINRAVEYGNLSKLIQVGTTCSYPGDVKVPTKEEYLFTGLPEKSNRPYGISKLSILYMMYAYREQYNLNGLYIIPSNMVGKFDTFAEDRSHVAAALLKRMHHARENNDPQITVFGDGTPTRDFVDAGDVAEGIIRTMETYNSTDPINLGSGREVSIKQLVQEIAFVTKYRGSVVYDPSKPNGQARRQLDITRAREVLGWEPRKTLTQSLNECYEYYKGRL